MQTTRFFSWMLGWVMVWFGGLFFFSQLSAEESKKGGIRKVWRVGGVGFSMRWIPAGAFTLGSPPSKAGRFEYKRPQRRAKISQGYWMMETEVTQGQWKGLMKDHGKPYFIHCGENCPMERVSWYDAAAFANQLSAQEKLEACFVGRGEKMKGKGNGGSDCVGCRGWRLPTEAEWEYAARAGATGARGGELNKNAWWGSPRGDGNAEVSYKGGFALHGKKWGTHPVGQKDANIWGLKDMLGNVWEWVYDGYSGDPCQRSYWKEEYTDPVCVAVGGTNRTIRGGGWNSNVRGVRFAVRSGMTPTMRGYYIGFRLIRSR